jgi:hypothetical protein
VTEEFAGRSAVVAIAPVPLAALHTAPLVALPQVQFAVVMPAGSGSLTCAPTAASGPLLLTTI